MKYAVNDWVSARGTYLLVSVRKQCSGRKQVDRLVWIIGHCPITYLFTIKRHLTLGIALLCALTQRPATVTHSVIQIHHNQPMTWNETLLPSQQLVRNRIEFIAYLSACTAIIRNGILAAHSHTQILHTMPRNGFAIVSTFLAIVDCPLRDKQDRRNLEKCPKGRVHCVAFYLVVFVVRNQSKVTRSRAIPRSSSSSASVFCANVKWSPQGST